MLCYSNAQGTNNCTVKFQKKEINFIIFSLTNSTFVLTLSLPHFVTKKTKKSKIILYQIVSRAKSSTISWLTAHYAYEFLTNY